MDETAKALLTFAGTAGGGAFLTLFIRGVGKWLSGAAHREQVKNTSLATQRTQAIKDREEADRDRDIADDRRRAAEETVSILRRQIIELGAIPKADIKPHREKTDE